MMEKQKSPQQRVGHPSEARTRNPGKTKSQQQRPGERLKVDLGCEAWPKTKALGPWQCKALLVNIGIKTCGEF